MVRKVQVDAMVTAMVTTMGMTLITATQNRGVFQNKQGNCLLLFPTVNRNVFFPTEKSISGKRFFPWFH